MQFSFTDQQEMLRDTVRDLLRQECPPSTIRAGWASDGRSPALWSGLADMGVLAMMAPEEAGGLGMNEIDLVRVVEEIGYSGVSDPVGEHAGVALPALVEGGATELAAAAVSGEITCTIALMAGGPYVLAGSTADVIVAERDGRLFAVTADQARLVPQKSMDEGRSLASIDFDPAEAAELATADKELAADRAVLVAASQCIGITRRLLDATVEYVAQREQFGKPVGSYQAVKHQLADVRIALEFAAPLAYRAAWSLTCHESMGSVDRGCDVSVAKAAASDAVDKACRVALQCHGAIGYTIEHDLQIWLKRGWSLSAAWGDARYHRAHVASALGI